MHLIVTTSELIRLYERITSENVDAVAIDTEFFRVNSYWPKLSLVQIAVGQDVYLVDALAADLDLTPLSLLLMNPGVCKIVHSGRQDFEIFNHTLGVLPENIFDTQIAAYILGQRESMGLADLLSHYLGIKLDKSDQNTDWLERPLTEKQLNYAANDVLWLEKVYHLLKGELIQANRFTWMQEEQSYLSRLETYAPDMQNLWRKVKSEKKFKPMTRLILQALCVWREEQAQAKDWNRGRVVADKVLVGLANHFPLSLDELLESDLPLSKDQRQQIWHRVLLTRHIPRDQWPSLPKFKGTPLLAEDKIKQLHEEITELVAKHKVDQRLLISSDEIKNIVHGEMKGRFCRGWRFELFGKDLIDTYSLTVDQEKVGQVSPDNAIEMEKKL